MVSCGIHRSEGSKIAGLSIDVDTWKPKAHVNDRKSVVYSATTESLFAESMIWGVTGIDHLVYEDVQVKPGKHPTLASLRLYTSGATNGLTISNSSDECGSLAF